MSPAPRPSSAARRTRRGAAAALAGLAVVLVGAGSAVAHVTVVADGATRGGYAVITFRVPTERTDASTVGVTVQLPTATPLASVSVLPQPGWTFAAPEAPLATPVTTDDGPVSRAVTQITWTAAPGAGIAPGEFGQFSISAGPLPDAPSITFKAVQTYSDGGHVDWVEQAAPGSSAEPEHPAPVLQLAAAPTSSAGATSAAAASTGTSGTSRGTSAGGVTVAARSTGGASTGAATTGIVLGAVGVLLGAAALTVALRRGRHTTG